MAQQKPRPARPRPSRAMDPALKRARALARATERSAARGARQEAELRHENRHVVFVGSPLPRHEVLDRVNTVRFAGGNVPASNTCGARPEFVTVDPLNVTRMFSQADRLNHADAIYTEGALEDGETFTEWDIYSGANGDIEDNIVAMLDGEVDMSKETIADRVETGTADLLDLIVYIHLETGEDMKTIAQRLLVEDEDDYSWYVDNDEDTFPEILTWTGTGKPKLTRVQERGRKNRLKHSRCDRHKEMGRYDRDFNKVRRRKENWMNGGNPQVRELIIPPTVYTPPQILIVIFVPILMVMPPMAESDSEEEEFVPVRESPPNWGELPESLVL